jgi:alpha-glucosidase
MNRPIKIFLVALIVLVAWVCLPVPAAADEPQTLKSPDGRLVVEVALKSNPQPYALGDRVYYRVNFNGVPVLNDSPLGLDFLGADPLDQDLVVTAVTRQEHNSTWENAFGPKRLVPDHYNEMTVSLRERRVPGRRLDIVFRAFNEGLAFRYSLPAQDALDKFTLASENTGFYFAADASAFALNMGRFNTHNEGEYLRTPLKAIKPAAIINLPLLVEIPGGPWAALLEADLTDYAGLYLGGVPGIPNALVSKLSPAPDRKAEEIVVGTTPKATPWRVLLLSPTPGGLIESNYLLLNLNPPCALSDTSWIKPGRAAWDWWSGSYATGVDFKPGMNTATMKHYIDFAAAHHLEYMLVDAGWAPPVPDSRLEDILHYIPEVNIPDIIAYGRAKGVKVLLWVEWRSLDTHLDEAAALYEKWGAAGIKVDYMNRDDQEMVNFYERCVRAAAAHHLVVDFHGAYKGTGLQRTFPNLLTREGIMGMEYCKWTERVTPEHDVTIPFTRMLAGPMDFTPGAFHNAGRGQFKAQDIAPMSQGTRAHQLAMYVVYESPLVMLSDYPEAYNGQPGLEFLEKVPTVWDDTKVLAGRPAEFILVARQHGTSWFVGGMTNWDGRDLEIPLGFLGPGAYVAQVFADGADADKNAASLSLASKKVKAGDKLTVHLAPGGGVALILTPVK